MGLENGVAPGGSDIDLQGLKDALVSSSTRWRLAKLSPLEEQLKSACKVPRDMSSFC